MAYRVAGAARTNVMLRIQARATAKTAADLQMRSMMQEDRPNARAPAAAKPMRAIAARAIRGREN
jgi:PHD/YefM family antitoxin component YafN of YafNO toxin-antitoxin module